VITVHHKRSLNGAPFIDIIFADGHSDSLVLEPYYTNQQERLERKQTCNFFGHLRDDPTACLAVTGCLGNEDGLLFTINSEHSGPSNMYKLTNEGQIEIIESPFKVSTLLQTYVPPITLKNVRGGQIQNLPKNPKLAKKSKICHKI
jgi:hypothetical protein